MRGLFTIKVFLVDESVLTPKHENASLTKHNPANPVTICKETTQTYIGKIKNRGCNYK